jgi:exoribonuclease II
MNILFEEDGAFRAGVLLADNNTSLQVELPGGKRSKVKSANVLLRFASPAAGDLIHRAQTEAAEIDIDFLWEVCRDEEFSFEELASEYHGQKPDALMSTSVLLRLHGAPMYFHRKGRGRFRKAPQDILRAALAGIEKKRLALEAIEQMADALIGGTLPTEIFSMQQQLLYAPDRNRAEFKALDAACSRSGKSVPRLLADCGAIQSTHDYQLGRFLFEYFPPSKGGTGFPDIDVGELADLSDLPLAEVNAFSIDDAATTEIDDAFSLVRHDSGWRVGIHIAAPALGFGPDSTLGQIARNRLSTVYMPGQKITMLPEQIVDRYTLAAGRTVPAVSLYLEFAEDYRLLSHQSVLERITISENLRHHDLEPLFNETSLADGLSEFDYRDELRTLWEISQVLQAGRGESGGKTKNRKDYSFNVDWDASPQNVEIAELGVIRISERPRGSPLDTLVAELMIIANATWGAALRDAGISALYRVQSAGKVRMSTVAAAHEGLGVDCYAWSSSPLRRYCDLLNQWQLIALLKQQSPPFGHKGASKTSDTSVKLLSAMRDFDLTYTAYAEFQRGMERYWCLRWLVQESRTSVAARVIKEDLVRFDEIPLILRVPSLPGTEAAPRGAAVAISVDGIDLLEAEIRARFVAVLAVAIGEPDMIEDEIDEVAGDEGQQEVAVAASADAELTSELPAETRSVEGLDEDGETTSAG